MNVNSTLDIIQWVGGISLFFGENLQLQVHFDLLVHPIELPWYWHLMV